MTLSDFVSRLQGAKRKTLAGGLEGYIARCPNTSGHANGDKNLSFAVWHGDDDWLHVKCQKGCTEGEIMSALGLSSDDRRVVDSQPRNGPAAVYVYTDKFGEYLFEKHRIQITGEKKDFRLKTKENGQIVHNLQHLNGWAGTLYNWPKVCEAIKNGETVYVNEGEKACDEMAKHGLTATCQPLGADEGNPASKWKDKHTEALIGAKVVIIADRDPTGEAYAAYVANELSRCAESVSIVQSATEGKKDDAYDHFRHGHDVTMFVPLTVRKPKPGESVGLRCFTGIEKKDIEWLWKPYLPLNGAVLVIGDPGVGKSSFAYALAAIVSRGQGAGGYPHQPPADVLLYCVEDDSERVIRKRLEDNEADMSHVFDGTYHETENPFGISPPITPEKIASVIAACKSLPNAKLVIFDPVVEWFPGNKSMNSGNESRDVLRMFRGLAEDCGVCSMLLGHPNKQSGSSLIYRASGSIDFSAVVRSALYAANVPDTGERALIHYKQNWGPMGKAIGYNIDQEGRFWFTGSTDVTEDMLNATTHEKPVTAKQLSSAKEWLEETLRREGSMKALDVFKGAKLEDFSPRTVKRAKSDLGVKSRKVGESWEWSLPTATPAYWQDKDDPYAD